jgi:TatA/E family protein of Tat protein translocase
MDFLSPAKLLVILVVALVVLGPDKLPKMAKQIGSLWGDFRKFRERLESDVRGNFPDLPSTEKITQAVRSPISFLDGLADSHTTSNGTNGAAETVTESVDTGNDIAPSSSESNRPAGTVRATEETPEIPDVLIVDPVGIVHQVRSTGPSVSDDPNLN